MNMKNKFSLRKLGLQSVMTGFLALFSLTVFAMPADGKRYDVKFLDNDGVALKVANLQFFADGDGFKYELNLLTKDPFKNHFLSMSPFHCITENSSESDKRSLCYLRYPYQNNHRITDTDLVDLEYDLLFIRRKASQYGIDPWFGMYFKLKWEGEKLVGTFYETDLNVLAAPPEDGSYRPIDENELVEAEDPEKFWLPYLVIEPSS